MLNDSCPKSPNGKCTEMNLGMMRITLSSGFQSCISPLSVLTLRAADLLQTAKSAAQPDTFCFHQRAVHCNEWSETPVPGSLGPWPDPEHLQSRGWETGHTWNMSVSLSCVYSTMTEWLRDSVYEMLCWPRLLRAWWREGSHFPGYRRGVNV